MNTKQTDERVTALAKFLGIDPEEVTLYGGNHYDLAIFEADGGEYAVGTDEEADESTKEYIKESLWAFRPSFLLASCGLPSELEEAIGALMEKQCESCNPALLALIEKCGDLDHLVRDSIMSDGRGHFLSSYDGDEIELGNDLYAYRIN
jgi:hypothetical protein